MQAMVTKITEKPKLEKIVTKSAIKKIDKVINKIEKVYKHEPESPASKKNKNSQPRSKHPRRITSKSMKNAFTTVLAAVKSKRFQKKKSKPSAESSATKKTENNQPRSRRTASKSMKGGFAVVLAVAKFKRVLKINELVKKLIVTPGKRTDEDCRLMADALFFFISSIPAFKDGLLISSASLQQHALLPYL